MQNLPALLLYITASLLCKRATGQCQQQDDTTLQQRRLQSLRNNILAQLDMTDPEPGPDGNIAGTPPTPEEMEVVETFNALQMASNDLEREKEQKCHSDEFYAKPVTSFVGIMSEEELMPSEITKRQTVSRTELHNVLNSYRITLDFYLPEDLTTISRADLLLYQTETNTSSTIYEIRDQLQYVEIRTVIGEPEERYIVEGKYIDLLEDGYQVFEITSAVRLWVAKKINGSAVLEVMIYCYSSPQCSGINAGKLPARVEFLHSTTESEKAPRVITVSKSPLEIVRNNRLKRSSSNSGSGYCSANRSICCLKELVINFRTDLGIPFIVDPQNFTANFCDGFCPTVPSHPELMTPRVYQFLSKISDGSPGSSVNPCCTGNTYNGLEVLMRTRGVLQIRRLQQVTVTSCRCS